MLRNETVQSENRDGTRSCFGENSPFAAVRGDYCLSPRKSREFPMKSIENAATRAADCVLMDEVRAEIDRIDRMLVALLAERQTYIEAAARIKDRESDIRVEWRIEDVLAKVAAAAEREGLSPEIAEPVWRELIERCIAHERECWRARRAGEKTRKAS